MSIRLVIVLWAAVILASSQAMTQQVAPASKPDELSAKELFAKVSPAVVRVVCDNGSGSGFFVSPNGWVITNYHVIEGATKVSVVLENNAKLEVKRILVQDKIADLALLDTGAEKVPTLPLATTQPATGDKVYAVGNPMDLKNSMSDGLVSGMREEHGIKYVQTSAPISSGSSGGPLLLATGEVVGVTTFTYRRSQNLNFAVLWTHIGNLITDAKAKPERSTQPADEITKEVELTEALASLPKEFLPSGAGWSDLKLQLANKWLDDTYALKPVQIAATFSSAGVFNNDLVYINWVARQTTWLGRPCRIEGLAGVKKDSYKTIADFKKGDNITIRGWVVDGSKGIVIASEDGISISVALSRCSITKGDVRKPVSSQPNSPVATTEASDEEKAKKKLDLAQTYINAGIKDKARTLLKSVVAEYPQTMAAETAKNRLKNLQEDPEPSKK